MWISVCTSSGTTLLACGSIDPCEFMNKKNLHVYFFGNLGNNVKFSKLTPMIYGNYEFDPLDKFS